MVRWNPMPVDDGLLSIVQEAKEKGVRAVRIEADPKRPRCIKDQVWEATDSLSDDLQRLGDSFEAAKPCVVMVRLQEKEKKGDGDDHEDWAVLTWMPEAAPTGQKLKYDGLHKSLKEHFETPAMKMRLRSVPISEKGENIAQFLMERMEPRASLSLKMSLEQQDQNAKLDKKVSDIQEQAEKVKFAIGVMAMQVDPQDSFKDSLGLVLAEKKGAMLARLQGENNNELVGEPLEHVNEPADLVGKLPKDQPCYVVMISHADKVQGQASLASEAEKAIHLITWCPEGVDARLGVVISATKTSVLQLLSTSSKPDSYELGQVEVHHEGDLTDELAFCDVELVDLHKRSSVLSISPPKANSAVLERSKSKGKMKRNPKCRRSTYIQQRASISQPVQGLGTIGEGKSS